MTGFFADPFGTGASGDPGPTASPEDFGHKPCTLNAGYCGGCVPCGALEEITICPRCTKHAGRPVEWPCTTAVVLGLARRL
jgi:hypothetical protein